MEYAITTIVGNGYVMPKLSPSQYNAYRNEQRELRRIINERCVAAGRKPVFECDIDDFSKYHIAPEGDGFKMIKREQPIDVWEFDNNGNACAIAGISLTRTEMTGINKLKGKYKDEALLHEEDTAGIEVGELCGGAGNGFFD